MKEIKKLFALLLVLAVAAFAFVSCDEPVEGGNDVPAFYLEISFKLDGVSYDGKNYIPAVEYNETPTLSDIEVHAVYYDENKEEDVTDKSDILYKYQNDSGEEEEINENEFLVKSGYYCIEAVYNSVHGRISITKNKNPYASEIFPISDTITLNISKSTWAYDEQPATVTYAKHPTKEIGTSPTYLYYVSKEEYDALSTDAEKENLINDYTKTDIFGWDIPVGTYYVFSQDSQLRCFSKPSEFTVTKARFVLVENYDYSNISVNSFTYGNRRDEYFKKIVDIGKIPLEYILIFAPYGNYPVTDSRGRDLSAAYDVLCTPVWKTPSLEVDTDDDGKSFAVQFVDKNGNFEPIDLPVQFKVSIQKGKLNFKPESLKEEYEYTGEGLDLININERYIEEFNFIETLKGNAVFEP